VRRQASVRRPEGMQASWPAPAGRRTARSMLRLSAVLALLLGLTSCATFRSFMALSQVQFGLERVTGVQVAGISLDRIRSYEDLTATDVARLGLALSSGTLPATMVLELAGQNPAGNPEARLLALDWVLFLQGRETVSGAIEDEIRLPPGESTTVPVPVSLDLMNFFQGSGRDMVDLALGLMGVGEESVDIRLEARPTIGTPLGPIRYPDPLILGR
jgi:hypothetical protein